MTGRRFAALGFMVCLQATSWGCSSRVTRAAAPGPQDASADCALIAEPGEPVATVALTDPVDPSHAPHPSNESERLLFRQIYETLVRVDCKGRVGPGLAASWRLDADGRTWIVTLRKNARFSDGTPVTAADVQASWSRDGRGDDLRPHVNRFIESVAVAGERDLAITLRSRRVDTPAPLAHPDLAIARSVTESEWPLGTRSARVAPEDRATVITVARDHLPAIRFLVAPGDPRDPLDDDVDLLLTRDPAALDYAATLPQFQSVPLPWQRLHLLLTPGRSRPPVLTDDTRQALAADAVRGEAQGARGPFWWQMVPNCEATPSPPPARSSPTPRIVYDATDSAARDLAERFVGLGMYSRATALTGEALARAQRLGTDAGYVMSVDSKPVDPCRDLQVLMDAAPWLDPEAIVPLVETRLRAIVRRGRAGVIAEWDGGLVIAGVNDAR